MSPPTFKEYDHFELIKESSRQVTRSAMKNYAAHSFSSTAKRRERPTIRISRKNETSVITDVASFEGSVLLPKRPKSSQGKHSAQAKSCKVNNITKGLHIADRIKVDDQKKEAVRGSLRRYLKLLKRSSELDNINQSSKTQLINVPRLNGTDKKFSRTLMDELRVMKH